MIVIDVGCAARVRDDGTLEESIPRLLDRFKPDSFFGCDPGLSGVPTYTACHDPKRIEFVRKAAWCYDGFVGYTEAGAKSQTGEQFGPAAVSCFDLANFIINLDEARIVLKMDVEGAEYVLLRHLHQTGADELLELLLVEWHGLPLDLPYRCPVELW